MTERLNATLEHSNIHTKHTLCAYLRLLNCYSSKYSTIYLDCNERRDQAESMSRRAACWFLHCVVLSNI